MTYTIEIQKDYALRVLEELQLLKAITIRKVSEVPANEEPQQTKEQLLAKVANALNDVKLYKKGKLKLKTLDEFLDEL